VGALLGDGDRYLPNVLVATGDFLFAAMQLNSVSKPRLNSKSGRTLGHNRLVLAQGIEP
jgi:hypothetical protein